MRLILLGNPLYTYEYMNVVITVLVFSLWIQNKLMLFSWTLNKKNVLHKRIQRVYISLNHNEYEIKIFYKFEWSYEISIYAKL